MGSRLILSLALATARTAVAQRGGPGNTPLVAQQPPVITALTIRGTADTIWASDQTVTLVHTVVGARPTEYRVSRRADFVGAAWQAYTPAPIVRDWYDAAGDACDGSKVTHRATLYFQVRSAVGEEVRIVDGQRQLLPARVESNVLRATACAHTARPSTPPKS